MTRAAAPEDLAERVRALEAKNETLLELLTQQQRVAQAGLVTAGLAHDVDNHVQIIIGSAYLAARRDDPQIHIAVRLSVQLERNPRHQWQPLPRPVRSVCQRGGVDKAESGEAKPDAIDTRLYLKRLRAPASET